MFYKEVNFKKRGEIIAFLRKHPRYNTMSSWNQSTSYANCIKLHKLQKPAEVGENIWWELFTMAQWAAVLSDLLEEFGRVHNWQWQAGINGRSGGYVVLYQGGIQPSGYQSYCTHCGQKNYQAVPDGPKSICGKCNAKERVNFKQTHMQVFTLPGKDTDRDEDFHGWEPFQLRDRVHLVQEFDRLGDHIIRCYMETCRSYRIIEEEILVPQTTKVLESIFAGESDNESI
jgi:hypothetical protein